MGALGGPAGSIPLAGWPRGFGEVDTPVRSAPVAHPGGLLGVPRALRASEFMPGGLGGCAAMQAAQQQHCIDESWL